MPADTVGAPAVTLPPDKRMLFEKFIGTSFDTCGEHEYLISWSRVAVVTLFLRFLRDRGLLKYQIAANLG